MSVSRQHASEPVRLNASKMFDYAFFGLIQALSDNGYFDLTELQAEHGMGLSYKIKMIEPDEKSEVYGARFTLTRYDGRERDPARRIKQREIVLLRPAADADQITPDSDNVGTLPLAAVLARVKALEAEDEKRNVSIRFIIPLAECHGKFHWTKLIINGGKPEELTLKEIREGKESVPRCEHIDPKSSPDDYPLPVMLFYKPYSIDPLKKILTAAGFECGALQTRFLGWQAVTNTTHCGYYVKESLEEDVTGQISIARTPEQLEKEFADCRKGRQYRLHIASNEAIAQARGMGVIPFKRTPPPGFHCLGENQDNLFEWDFSSDEDKPSPRAGESSSSSSSSDEQLEVLSSSDSSDSINSMEHKRSVSPLSLLTATKSTEFTKESKFKLSPEEERKITRFNRRKKWRKERRGSSPPDAYSPIFVNSPGVETKETTASPISQSEEFTSGTGPIQALKNKYWPAITGAIIGTVACIVVAAILLHPLGIGLAATTIGAEVCMDIGYFLGAMFCGALFGASVGAAIGQCRAHFISPGYDDDVKFPVSAPSSTQIIGNVVGLSAAPKESKYSSAEKAAELKIATPSPKVEVVEREDDTFSIFRQRTGVEGERFMGPRC